MNTNDSNLEKTLQTKKPTISLPLSHNKLCHGHHHHIYWWMQRGNKNCTSKQTCVKDPGSFHCLCILGVWAKKERERELGLGLWGVWAKKKRQKLTFENPCSKSVVLLPIPLRDCILRIMVVKIVIWIVGSHDFTITPHQND